jgi:hypothetical protein
MTTYSFTCTTASVDGASAVPDQGNMRSGRVLISGRGTWGGATLAVQVSTDGTNFVAYNKPEGAALTFTADFAYTLNLPPGVAVRGRLTTAGSGATITGTIVSEGA